MSLTSFLGDKDHKDVRARFSQEFTKPRFATKKEIIAPPITQRYSLVGTAFDYILRFYVERLNPQAITGPWVAEKVVKGMKVIGVARAFSGSTGLNDNLVNRCEQALARAKAAYGEYITSGVMSDDLLAAALTLGQLDTYYRSGFIDENFGAVDEGDVLDLRNLAEAIDPDTFRTEKLCILNPEFGSASSLVKGADADLLIDEALLEIKTTKTMEFKRDHFNQLVGYYVLSRIGGDDVSVQPEIHTLGVYWSRFAVLQTFPVGDGVAEDTLPAFIQWFKQRAGELYRSS